MRSRVLQKAQPISRQAAFLRADNIITQQAAMFPHGLTTNPAAQESK